MKKYVYLLSRIANAVGIAMLMVLMLVIVTDVFMRYVFHGRVLGGHEITEFTMVIAVFMATAYTMAQKGHITVDVIVSRFPSRVRHILNAIVTILSIMVLAVITWRTVIFAQAQWRRGVTSSVLYLPVSPFILVVTFGVFLLCLVLLTQLSETVALALKKSSWKTWLAFVIGTLLALLFFAFPFWWRDVSTGMNLPVVALLGIGVILVFLFSGMPIGFAMALIGFLGVVLVSGADSGLAAVGRIPFVSVANEILSVLPMYLLMGQFVFTGGISEELYRAAYKWFGHLRGGLAVATIGACAGFAAVCGSSSASAATMGTITLPEMKKYKYDPALATGSVAAGGTLAFLIPPSAAFVVIGLISEQSIGRLFIAGMVPGVLLTVLFMLVIWIITRININLGPPAAKSSWSERMTSLKGLWATLALFLLVIGGIYMGVFTPTESAAVGAFGALLIMFVKRKLTWKNFYSSLLSTGQTTAMVFTIFVGAIIFGLFMSATGSARALMDTVSALSVNRYVIFAIVVVIYVILGCVMEFLAVVLFTVPIVFPLLMNLGFDGIWLGVITVITAETALITPPVGMNVFVITAIAKDVSMFTVFRGIMPFFFALVACIIILTVFPQIALFLPNLMKGG